MTQLLPILRELLHVPERLRIRKALRSRKLSPPRTGIALNYGSILSSAARLAGGKVKLTHLAQRWPETENFNFLYLVSSALPPQAIELVRWAKSQGARFVWNQNGVGFPAWAQWRTPEKNYPLAKLLREADHVVYQSEFCRESADYWLEKATCPSSVLINPVDTAVFKPAPAPTDVWRLLAAGTHYQPFRVIGALETLRVLLDSGHRATLTVAGELRWQGADGETHETITRLRLSEFVTLRPAFTQQEAVGLYQSSHVLLHLKYLDPCPTVAIEALACGLPVVALRGGGMPEIVGNDGGELLHIEQDWWRASYPPARRIASAISLLMKDWPRHSAAARTRAATHFTKEAWVDAHARIFEGLQK